MDRSHAEHIHRGCSPRRTFVLAAILAVVPLSALAQESRGSISGRVIDTSGGVLPG